MILKRAHLRVARSAPSASERYLGSSFGASQGSSLLNKTLPLLLQQASCIKLEQSCNPWHDLQAVSNSSSLL